ncbi:MAG TPA: hypothetical protein VFM91_00095, partial [Propionibacteriaceae bacterium]|nr:hypothetical protein [Propionibacteriaceae bacterium]
DALSLSQGGAGLPSQWFGDNHGEVPVRPHHFGVQPSAASQRTWSSMVPLPAPVDRGGFVHGSIVRGG